MCNKLYTFLSVQNNGLSTATCKTEWSGIWCISLLRIWIFFFDNLSWHDILKQLLMLYHCGGLICGNEKGLIHSWRKKIGWKRGKCKYISDIGAVWHFRISIYVFRYHTMHQLQPVNQKAEEKLDCCRISRYRQWLIKQFGKDCIMYRWWLFNLSGSNSPQLCCATN